MPDPIIIVNGPYDNEPIGRLTALDGHTVIIWDKTPAALLAAMTDAIGPKPDPVDYGLGGEMVETGRTAGGPWGEGFVTYTYNPAGDVLNTAKVAEFTALVNLYVAKVQAIQAAVVAMLAAKSS